MFGVRHRARGSDPRAVEARAREFVEAKTGDIKSILGVPEHQLKMVLDKVERGRWRPRSDRVIDGGLIVGAGGALGGGAGATMGGGFAPRRGRLGT